jgi:hypothetical protein
MANPKPTPPKRVPKVVKQVKPLRGPVAVKERAKAWLKDRGKPSRPGPKPS